MKKPVMIALLSILAVILSVSGYMIIDTISEYGKATEAYSDTADTVVEMVTQTDAIAAPIEVDFDVLCESGENIIGWIYCAGTEINYPVVQGEDNRYYVRRLPDGTYNTAGSIFMDYQCAPDCSDFNTILYGHNMRNGTMFAALKKYMDQSFYDEHPIMWFLTPEKTFMLEIAAGYVTSARSDSFEMFADKEEMSEYLDYSMKKSNFISEVDLESIERIVTLATCSYEYDTARYVLICSLVPCDGAVSETDA